MGQASPASPRFCTRCGTAWVAGGRFCAACGAPRDAPGGTPPLPGAGLRPQGPSPGIPRPPSGSDRTVLIAVGVVVAVVLISTAIAGLLFLELSGSTPAPSPWPLGTAFELGRAVSGTCSAAMVGTKACASTGDFVYQISVAYASCSIGDVNFSVETATGFLFQNSGPAEFSLVTTSGTVAALSPDPAGAGLAMSGTWADYQNGFSSSSSFVASTLAIVVDMGQTAPTTGLNLQFVAMGSGNYVGSVTLTLP